MSRQDHISALRAAIREGAADLDAFLDGLDVGDICAAENYNQTYKELQRKQQARKNMLERLLKKEQDGQTQA